VTGLFGGAFDPPHLGHVALLERARERFSFQSLVVLVVADPGHKQVHAEAAARLELARAAFPDTEVELDPHARTIDMLRERGFDDPLLLVGADELVDLPTWKEPNEVLRLARLGVATRPGYPQDRIEAALEQLDEPERVLFFEIEPVPVSSSEIRERVARGEPIDDLVPAAVARAIEESRLYRS
jgi:nicotinate-nucleotide adenylyltransferase